MAKPLPNAYFNGAFQPLSKVQISPLDRGFLFGDGVYEVIPVYSGRLFHLEAHLKRLQYSLDGIRLENPHTQGFWTTMLKDLTAMNGGGDQALYLQVTRGADTGRDHAFPVDIAPTVFAMCAPLAELPSSLLEQGAKAMSLEDIRWRRCDIKSVSLLGNVLLRQTALDQGCSEAVLVRDGYATEGTASSIFIVHQDVVITPPKSAELLPSITRDVVLELAVRNGIQSLEARVPVAQLQTAQEIWFASSTREIYPVTSLDGHAVGDGKPGRFWKRLYDLFQSHKAEQS
ncbi:MAG: D-amino acid aminotransferase [Gammaproteobacteria bacterium]|nr:D-amino acid aminotransferase [Gammaproteobacteria bacterium]MDE2345318.1 D-amino acid aminotransferase [Gammaproteobacteria bacterium]